MQFLNIYTLKKDRVKPITFDSSITQPDEALTIQQILDRVSRGLTTGVGAPGADDYDDENDHDWDDPTIQPGFDKLDALEYTHSDKAHKLRKQVAQEEEEKQRSKQKKEFDDAVAAEIERRKKEETQE